MSREIVILPSAHADKKTENQSTKMGWAEIQSCANELDGIKNKPDENWVAMHPDDIPAWVKKKDTMGQMMNGMSCSNAAGEGGLWFRAVHCQPPSAGKGLIQ